MPRRLNAIRFWARIRRQMHDYYTREVGDEFSIALEHEFMDGLQELINRMRHKKDRMQKVYVASKATTKRQAQQKINTACRTLGINLPKNGQVDLKMANTNKKRLALLYHPDRNGGQTSEMYQKVMDAYDTLETFVGPKKGE